MKKNGFTITYILILIIILGVSALLILPKVSNALKLNDNKEELYNGILNIYKQQAEKYGNDKKEEVKASPDSYVVSIDDLIKEDYIGATAQNGSIIDIRDNVTKMNNIKFKLNYNEDTDTVTAEQLK